MIVQRENEPTHCRLTNIHTRIKCSIFSPSGESISFIFMVLSALPVSIKMRNLASVPGFGSARLRGYTGLGLRDQCDTLTAITSALCPPTPFAIYTRPHSTLPMPPP